METNHEEEEGENGVSIHLETSSSSSSSSSSSYLSPQNLPDTPTDSPPVQVMERDDNVDEGILKGYDPDRIPSSVFERSKSNIPAEWSCTSNESLFSIHLGRNSFYGNDLMKSCELYKSGELLAYSPALPMPPPPGSEPPKKPVLQQEPSKILLLDDSDKEEQVVVLVQEEQQHPAVSWKTPSTSYRSNHSSNSARSFSFPILAGAANESSNAETEERKKQGKESQEKQQQPEEAGGGKNQKPSSIMCKWFSCFPPCPWCCSLHSPCSCS